MTQSFDQSDLSRRFEQLIKIGTIEQLDFDNKKFKVKSGDLLTDWLPWPADISNNYIRWKPLRQGAQIILACPSGDPAQAVLVGELYSAAQPAPASDSTLEHIAFNSGAHIEYDAQTNNLNIQGFNQVNVSASTKVILDTPLTKTTGDLEVGGDINAAGEISDATRSMSADRAIYNGHNHPGVGTVIQKQ